MTPKRLSECLTEVRWTEYSLAAALECDVLRVRAWLDGSEDIPPKVAGWLEVLALAHRAAESSRPDLHERGGR